MLRWCSLVLTGHGDAPTPVRVGQCVNPDKGRADRPMTPPRHRIPMHTTQLVAPIRVGGVRPRDERSRRLDLSRPFFLANALEATRLRNSHGEQIRSTQSEELRKASKASKASPLFGLILKASMVGFTLLSRSYYYLRRRSPGPPFPPDHRQAGERGAIIHF